MVPSGTRQASSMKSRFAKNFLGGEDSKLPADEMFEKHAVNTYYNLQPRALEYGLHALTDPIYTQRVGHPQGQCSGLLTKGFGLSLCACKDLLPLL